MRMGVGQSRGSLGTDEACLTIAQDFSPRAPHSSRRVVWRRNTAVTCTGTVRDAPQDSVTRTGTACDASQYTAGLF
ncbi:hypothetical protein [Paenibacillus chitinolyticus]|uniref:hypothetical protein n=1 Tax=Paenibacillus chitinolyticus TaxID=79263 RepID=UPI001C47F2FE|nr:hypothetical protein [Paenibacillus chitinolyticus]MBV6712494.1 hypothetical protein [Paenibacillus chitinolyticus]